MAQLRDTVVSGSLRATDSLLATNLILSGSQTARYVLAAPTTNGAPSFRALTNADVGLGNVENTKLSTWAGSSNLTTCSKGTFGNAVTYGVDDATANGALGSGTGLTTERSVYYGLVTVNNASQTRATGIYAPTSAGTANQILVSAGGTSAPTWKATASGAAYATSANGALTFGTLPVAQGGTNATSVTKYGIAYGNASANGYTFTAAGTDGYLLMGKGASAAPEWIQATNSNTGSTIVKRDSNGDFSARNITSSLVYFGSGTTYYINSSGTANLYGLTTNSTATFKDSVYINNNKTALYIYFKYNNNTKYTSYLGVLRGDPGDGDLYYNVRFRFLQYSYNSSTKAQVNYYEDYQLPIVAADLSESKSYNILTSKDLSFSITGNAATATRINGNLGAISDENLHNFWVSNNGTTVDGIPKYVSGVYVQPSTKTIYCDNLIARAGYLKATNNGNTVAIGSQNEGFCHITNSANIPFYFNKSIYPTTGVYIYNTNSYLISTTCRVCNTNGDIELNASTNRGIYERTDTKWIIYLQNTDDTVRSQYKIYGAVWNDYAEYRIGNELEAGRCVTESKFGMIRTTERLQPGCRVTSDTFGFAIGQTETANVPIAVSGRVLVYPYRQPSEYPLGAAVCSAPNGTVDIMTREEIMKYPERIIGTVSEVPNYDIWYGGSLKTEETKEELVPIEVKGRIWIYVK